MLVMNEDLLAERAIFSDARHYRRQGTDGTRSSAELWNYQQIALLQLSHVRYPCRLAGTIQPDGRLCEQATANRANYNERLADLPVRLPFQHEDTGLRFNYVIRLNLDELISTR